MTAISAPGSEVHVSLASAWEMAIKIGSGKWPEATKLLTDFEQQLELDEFQLLSVSLDHVRGITEITATHRDPFDRLLATQARIEGLTLVTADPKIPALGAAVLW